MKNNLFSKKENNKDWHKNSLGEIISQENINSYIAELDLDSAKEKLKNLLDWNSKIINNKATWQDYFDTLDDGENYIVDLIKNTDNLSKLTGEDLVKANQQARATSLSHNEALKAQTLSAKAGKTALQALAMAGNMIAMWAFTEVVSTIHSCITASDRLKESASDLGSQFSSTKSDIEGYKTKINDLYKTINDSSSSYEDTYNARQELLTIQDEMIEKFGSEAEAVQLVTNAINGQTEVLDSLTKQKWQETVNAFNFDPDKKWTEQLGDNWANLWSGSSNNFDRMIKEMENTEVSFHVIPLYGDKTYEEFSRKLKENFGASITKTQRDDIFTLSGDLDDIYDQLLNIQSLAKDMGINDSSMSDLSRQTEKSKNTLESYQEIFNQHVLYDKIFDNEAFEQSFNNINDAYKQYLEIFASGNEESISKAKQNFAEIVQTATEGINDKSVIDYFNSMYPDLQAVVGAWEFEVDFKDSIDDENNDLVNKVKNIFDNFDKADDIYNYNPKLATQEQIDAYTQLEGLANKYNLTLDELINKCSQMGLISSQVKNDLLDKLIPSRSGLTAGFQSDLDTAFAKVNADAATEWVKSLSEEDARLANSHEFEQALEEQKNRLNDTTLSANDYAAALQNVKDAQIDSGLDKKEVSTFEEAWANSFISEEDKVKELGNTLLNLAENGRLTAETFNKADSTGYFKNWGISADEAILKINKLVDESNQLSSLSGQISAMANALGTKQKDGFVSADTLTGFDVEVRTLESWDRFQEVLGSTASSYDECQKAANTLAAEWVNSNDFLTQLTEQNREYYETQLEAMGIENAAEVVSEALALKTEELNIAKEYLAETGKKLTSVSELESAEFIANAAAAGKCSQQFAALQLQKILCNENWLDSAKDINGLLMLAEAAGISGDAIAQLSGLKIAYDNAVANGDSNAAIAINNQMQNLKTQIANEVANIGTDIRIDLGNVGGGASKAGSAGKDAGDACVDAFEEELEELQRLKDDGVITEKEYLDRLRALYERYFKDKLGYEREFAKYQKQYLEGYKSLYDSALSGISKLMDSKIDGYTHSKETAIESLETEQEAAEAVYQAQIDAIQEQIDAIDNLIDEKNKQIDAIEDEINKIKEASEARKRDIELQKAQYELERMQNQRTILQYSENQGIHYVQDTDGIRDASEKVTEIREDMQIAELEKQVSLIETEIELLNGQKTGLEIQQDAIRKMMDESNKYYESLISEQENYWNSLIQNLEEQKSRWQELADIQEVAEAFAAVEQVFGELGYTVDDILNGNAQAFEDFRNKYIAIISDLNQNTALQNGLEYASGINKENFGSIIADINSSMQQEMNKLGLDAGDGFITGWNEKSGAVLESTKQTAMDAVEAFARGQNSNSPSEEYKALAYEAIDGLLLGVEERKQTFIDSMEALAKEGSLAFMEGFNFEDEASISTLADALKSISDLSFGSIEENETDSVILAQFEKLKSSVADVTNAISGGSNKDNSDDASASLNAGASGGLAGAIDQLKQTADNVLGSGGGEGSDNEGAGIIGQFTQLKEAVNDVTASIGSGEEGSESDSSKTDVTSLTGAVTNLGVTTENILTGGEDGGESGGVIGRFEEFKNVIGEANEHITGISDGLTAIDGQEVECTIRVNIETNGDLPAAIGAAGAFGTGMNLKSSEYKADYSNGGYQGKASVTGHWGTHQGGRTLVGELGPEMVVRGSRFFTVGNNGAEFVNLQKGDIVFNHKQTHELLKNGHITNRGNALADGTVNNKKLAFADNDPIKIRQKLFDDYVNRMGGIMNVLVPPVNAIQKNTENMVNNSFNNMNTGRLLPSITIGDVNVTCPGVTSQEVMEQVGAALNRNFAGMSLDALQQSMIRR